MIHETKQFQEHFTVYVRISEILSMEGNKDIPEYDRKKLISYMPKLSKISKEHKNTRQKGFEKCKDLLYDCGINLFFVETLPTVPVWFLTRWYSERPLIQFSRLAFENNFWFNLFHCIGHIAKHGKKRMFVEMGLTKRDDPQAEKEADKFASKYLKQTQ